MGSDPQSYLQDQHERTGRAWLKELLEQNRASLALLPKWLGGSGGYEKQIADLVSERDRLREENEQLRSQLASQGAEKGS